MTVTVIVPVDAPLSDRIRASFDDFRRTWRTRHSWMLAALRMIGNRYRRTVLGPWWLTLTTLFFVFGLALLRVGLGGGDLRESIPYVGLGFIVFSLISGGINAGVSVYSGAGLELSTSRQPYSMYVMRANAVQVIDFLHDAVAILALVLVFAIPLTLAWGWSVIAILLIVIANIGIGLWLGPLVARFRDVAPMVQMIMRLMFFLTPIFWSVDMVSPQHQAWLTWWNPFTYQVLSFRDPILGTPHGTTLIVSACWTLANVVAGVIVFTLCRARIPYWSSG